MAAQPLPAVPVRPALPGSRSGLVGLAERVTLAGGRLQHGPRHAEPRPQPAQPAHPAQSAQPAQSAHPAQSIQPAQPAQPGEVGFHLEAWLPWRA